jgi:hypothetical protein
MFRTHQSHPFVMGRTDDDDDDDDDDDQISNQTSCNV